MVTHIQAARLLNLTGSVSKPTPLPHDHRETHEWPRPLLTRRQKSPCRLLPIGDSHLVLELNL